MSLKLKLLHAMLLATLATSSLAMTKSEYAAEKQRIANEYKSAILHCRTLVGNARDVCKQQAKGRVAVAKAQLKARAEPSAKSQYKVDIGRPRRRIPWRERSVMTWWASPGLRATSAQSPTTRGPGIGRRLRVDDLLVWARSCVCVSRARRSRIGAGLAQCWLAAPTA